MKATHVICTALLGLLMMNHANAQTSGAQTTSAPASAGKSTVTTGRITAPDPATMNEAQRAEYERSFKTFGGALGPRMPLLNSPEVLAAWSQMQDALTKSSLPPKLREVAILVVGSEWKSEFEWYAHAEQARRSGVSPEAVEAMRVGKQPKFSTPEEEIVYRYAHELVTTHQVSDSAYQAAWKLLGTRTLVDLTVLIGHYTSVAMTLNAHRMPLPKGVAPSF
jgi:4-carboxymuconolactone decarboxylase